MKHRNIRVIYTYIRDPVMRSWQSVQTVTDCMAITRTKLSDVYLFALRREKLYHKTNLIHYGNNGNYGNNYGNMVIIVH